MLVLVYCCSRKGHRHGPAVGTQPQEDCAGVPAEAGSRWSDLGGHDPRIHVRLLKIHPNALCPVLSRLVTFKIRRIED